MRLDFNHQRDKLSEKFMQQQKKSWDKTDKRKQHFFFPFRNFSHKCVSTWKKHFWRDKTNASDNAFRCSKLIFLSDMHMVIKLAVISCYFTFGVFSPFGQSRIIPIKLIDVCVCACVYGVRCMICGHSYWPVRTHTDLCIHCTPALN